MAEANEEANEDGILVSAAWFAAVIDLLETAEKNVEAAEKNAVDSSNRLRQGVWRVAELVREAGERSLRCEVRMAELEAALRTRHELCVCQNGPGAVRWSVITGPCLPCKQESALLDHITQRSVGGQP